MANNTYTLKLKLDTSGLAGMMNASGIPGGGGSGGAGGGAEAAVSGGEKDSGIGKMLGNKLTDMLGELTAIGSMLQKAYGLMVEASPLLQVMLKLFKTSILLIFRPIGDFFAMFLRPIMIVFLRYIALPFYKYWGPIARNLGTIAGNFVASGIMGILGLGPNNPPSPQQQGQGTPFSLSDSFNSTIDTLTGAFGVLSAFLSPVIDKLALFLPSLNFIPRLQQIFSILGGIINEIGKYINLENLFAAVDSTVKFFEGIWTGIKDTIRPTWDALTSAFAGIGGFFSDIKDNIESLLKPAWSTMSGWIAWIGSVFLNMGTTIRDTLKPMWDSFTEWFTFIANAFAGLGAKINETIKPAWDAFTEWASNITTDIKEAFVEFLKFLKNPISYIGDMLKQDNKQSSGTGGGGGSIFDGLQNLEWPPEMQAAAQLIFQHGRTDASTQLMETNEQ